MGSNPTPGTHTLPQAPIGTLSDVSNEAIVVAVVAGSVFVLLVLVLAPWRGLRRDSLDEEDYYALMAGEDVSDEPAPPSPRRPEHEGEEGPGLGDVEIP